MEPVVQRPCSLCPAAEFDALEPLSGALVVKNFERALATITSGQSGAQSPWANALRTLNGQDLSDPFRPFHGKLCVEELYRLTQLLNAEDDFIHKEHREALGKVVLAVGARVSEIETFDKMATPFAVSHYFRQCIESLPQLGDKSAEGLLKVWFSFVPQFEVDDVRLILSLANRARDEAGEISAIRCPRERSSSDAQSKRPSWRGPSISLASLSGLGTRDEPLWHPFLSVADRTGKHLGGPPFLPAVEAALTWIGLDQPRLTPNYSNCPTAVELRYEGSAIKGWAHSLANHSQPARLLASA